MKGLTCTALFLFVFLTSHGAWAHDEPLASDCPSSAKGNQNSKRPLARPGKERLRPSQEQLRAAKEELRTAKKGLRTVQEQLPAVEEELRAAEERLRAAMAGLRAARLPAAQAELLAEKGCLEGGGAAAREVWIGDYNS